MHIIQLCIIFFPSYKDSRLPRRRRSGRYLSYVPRSDEDTKMKTGKLKQFIFLVDQGV